MTQCEFEVCDLHVLWKARVLTNNPVMRLKAFFFFVRGFCICCQVAKKVVFWRVLERFEWGCSPPGGGVWVLYMSGGKEGCILERFEWGFSPPGGGVWILRFFVRGRFGSGFFEDESMDDGWGFFFPVVLSGREGGRIESGEGNKKVKVKERG